MSPRPPTAPAPDRSAPSGVAHPDGKNASLPDVWGAGQLLSFSALDGPTSWDRPFVLHTGAGVGELDVKLPVEAAVRWRGLPPLEARLVLGDAFRADADGDRFTAVFADAQALVGEAPAGAALLVDGEAVGEVPREVGRGMGRRLMAASAAGRWALFTLDGAGEEGDAAARWEALRRADVDVMLAARRRFVEGVPATPWLSSDRRRLLLKAASALKVNVESPAGVIGCRWTTPDRWPHRKLWLWDSAFHAVGWAHLDLAVAQDALTAIVQQAEPDGRIPLSTDPHDRRSAYIQAPVLAWATLYVLNHGGDADWARACADRLEPFLRWLVEHRDENRNGVPEWKLHDDDPLCRCGEAQDNSPRFDAGRPVDAVDFGAWLTHDFDCLARLLHRLDEPTRGDAAAAEARRIGDATDGLLWHSGRNFYLDRYTDGTWSDVASHVGFTPLWAGLPSPERARRLAEHLDDPARFGSALPVPSVPLDSGAFSKDMFRGPVWVNLNYMIERGLRRYGLTRQADHVRDATLDAVARWYQREGCLFEFYDALDLTSPRDLDRKARLALGEGVGPISDFGWTAALTVAWLMEAPASV